MVPILHPTWMDARLGLEGAGLTSLGPRIPAQVGLYAHVRLRDLTAMTGKSSVGQTQSERGMVRAARDGPT